MEIGAIPHQAFPSMGYAINASSSGRASLPVAPGMVIYSHLKHVSGTPAPEGTEGVNINKLRILDTLIEQLAKMKNQDKQELAVEDLDRLTENDENRINALIEQYQKEIRIAQSTGYYAPAMPATGLLFNIAA
ncbi:MAG: hypothetical protein FWD26_04025 [Treponema sp.]|nr:hypothetical protein [Treponema sp.]